MDDSSDSSGFSTSSDDGIEDNFGYEAIPSGDDVINDPVINLTNDFLMQSIDQDIVIPHAEMDFGGSPFTRFVLSTCFFPKFLAHLPTNEEILSRIALSEFDRNYRDEMRHAHDTTVSRDIPLPDDSVQEILRVMKSVSITFRPEGWFEPSFDVEIKHLLP